MYIGELLWETSDEQHPLTATQIMEGLAKRGITCDRKTIYSDLETLEEFGLDIIRTKQGAYIGKRHFELPELKLLVDAAQASKFITEKKSEELIDKLSRLANEWERKQLKRQVYVKHRVKNMNESIYYNVDAIEEGLRRNCKISFTYWQWNERKEMTVKQNGQPYVVSPWLVLWEKEKYYLVGYDEAADKLKHFRVDKMQNIMVLDEKRKGKEQFDQIDIEAYTVENFSMFQGKREQVTLRLSNELVGVMLDRFGTNLWLHPVNHEESKALVNVVVSNQFFGWIVGLGGKVRIESPLWVCQEFETLLSEFTANKS